MKPLVCLCVPCFLTKDFKIFRQHLNDMSEKCYLCLERGLFCLQPLRTMSLSGKQLPFLDIFGCVQQFK